MIRIIKNSTLRKITEISVDMEKHIHNLTEELKELDVNKTQEIYTLEEEVKALKKQLGAYEQEENSVTLSIDDTLTKVTPIVRYKAELLEKLIELGYVQDDIKHDKFAIQLGVLTVANEALNQIMEAFSEPMEDI